MNYTKPEVAVLGEAVRVIESHTAKIDPPGPDGVIPPFARHLNPAYDLED